MKFHHLLLFLFIGSHVQTSISENSMVNVEKENYFNQVEKLQMKLLKDYNIHVRPAVNYSHAINVNISMDVLHFSLDEHKSQLTVSNYFRMNWKDERLQWKPADYDGLGVLHIPSQLIWTPDITLYTSLMGNDNHDFGNVEVLIYPDGTVLHVPPAKFVVPCPMNFRSWPFDQQKCRLRIGSWTYNGYQINLNTHDPSKPIEMNDLIETENWKLMNINASVYVSYYSCCVEPYPAMDVTFVFQRNSPLFQYSTLASSFVIGLLTLATFCLPSNATEKLAVSLVDLLVIFICQVYLKDVIPTRGHQLPLIVYIYSYTSICIAFSVLVNALAIKWTRCRPSQEPPQWARLFINGLLCHILCLGNESIPIKENKPSETDEIHQQWMTLSRTLDRLVSIVFIVVSALALVNPTP